MMRASLVLVPNANAQCNKYKGVMRNELHERWYERKYLGSPDMASILGSALVTIWNPS